MYYFFFIIIIGLCTFLSNFTNHSRFFSKGQLSLRSATKMLTFVTIGAIGRLSDEQEHVTITYKRYDSNRRFDTRSETTPNVV